MATTADKPTFNRKNPLLAKLKESWELTRDCDSKHTAHYTIDLQSSGLSYLPGDSLAVLPQNNTQLVDELISALGCDPSELVSNVNDPEKGTIPLRQALIENHVITTIDKKFLTAFAEKLGSAGSEIKELLVPDKKKELAVWLWGKEIIDLLLAHPEVSFSAEEFTALLKKLNVRLYSISSSLTACPDEVHLTVATVKYESQGREREGVCSTWLANRIDQETAIPCFITPGKNFRLPEAGEDTPIIMIGPGTGIAPFRAFLQERAATEAKGEAWLFFGEIHEESCFFYKDEFTSWQKEGVLNKLTTAFSRDQENKIYVQDRIREESEELYNWLERGAIVYVCGDANRMAPDVDKAIREAIASHGNKSEEEVDAYMDKLKTQKRYRRDVY